MWAVSLRVDALATTLLRQLSFLFQLLRENFTCQWLGVRGAFVLPFPLLCIIKKQTQSGTCAEEQGIKKLGGWCR